jgi:polysaccharide export outer membrane protein
MRNMVFSLTVLAFGIVSLSAQGTKTSKELFEYVQEARKLGLSDDQIRKNAVVAGWDQLTIDQTYAIVRTLNKETMGSAETARIQSIQTLPDGYRIGPGDSLAMVVWKEPEASVPETVVRADGKISVPLVKEIHVAGFTPSELEKVLMEKFERLIAAPDVTVVPKQIRSMRIYMVGAVKREGPIPMAGPMTVLQALTEAGGITDYAKKNKIYILRTENGRQMKLPFDYKAVLNGERIEQNILLKPEDTIVVPN